MMKALVLMSIAAAIAVLAASGGARAQFLVFPTSPEAQQMREEQQQQQWQQEQRNYEMQQRMDQMQQERDYNRGMMQWELDRQRSPFADSYGTGRPLYSAPGDDD
jgi:hypothetical protein